MSDKLRTKAEMPHDPVTPTTPLRLEIAAKIAFPDGSMKLAGLRREIARGRLSYEMIAGKHYTTLSDIEDMRRLCRVQANAPRADSSRRAGLISPAVTASDILRLRLSRSLQKGRKNRKVPSTE